mmetsp:Transcript_18973/g.71814  ORF Transcript_18973/g.71814 Transcript_18973/m.71814 type:complete len:438 (+) Transcript_18973:1233-2546(+)
MLKELLGDWILRSARCFLGRLTTVGIITTGAWGGAQNLRDLHDELPRRCRDRVLLRALDHLLSKRGSDFFRVKLLHELGKGPGVGGFERVAQAGTVALLLGDLEIGEELRMDGRDPTRPPVQHARCRTLHEPIGLAGRPHHRDVGVDGRLVVEVEILVKDVRLLVRGLGGFLIPLGWASVARIGLHYRLQESLLPVQAILLIHDGQYATPSADSRSNLRAHVASGRIAGKEDDVQRLIGFPVPHGLDAPLAHVGVVMRNDDGLHAVLLQVALEVLRLGHDVEIVLAERLQFAVCDHPMLLRMEAGCPLQEGLVVDDIHEDLRAQLAALLLALRVHELHLHAEVDAAVVLGELLQLLEALRPQLVLARLRLERLEHDHARSRHLCAVLGGGPSDQATADLLRRVRNAVVVLPREPRDAQAAGRRSIFAGIRDGLIPFA